jgi:hypothetical protein
MYHAETMFADHSRIRVRRHGGNAIAIRPEDFQGGDIICDSFGRPLRDKANRQPKDQVGEM